MTSALQCKQSSPLHVAIIMDGNGRWAERRALARCEGHRAGIEALRRVVEAAPSLGIGTLTVHAFSADNWKRPPQETSALMELFRSYLDGETETLVADGIRLCFLGRRDRLPQTLRDEMERAETLTQWGDALCLRVAVDYSARAAIALALQNGEAPGPDVDLLIRTSGEQRLSDFLLWECAYAELYFTPTLWPDITAADLQAAVTAFYSRQRRFGALPIAAE
jgi:undecaprenyl diphosphate synthase